MESDGSADNSLALSQGGARHRRMPFSRWLSHRPAGAEPADQQGHRGRRDRAEQGHAAPDGPRRVRPRRHPQPVHRQGDPQRRRRHRGARGRRVLRAPLGRARHVEGDQRDGRHAAVRGVPEGAVGASGHPQVHLRGVRLAPARPGGLRRGPQRPAPTAGGLRPRQHRHRGLRPRAGAGAGPTSR